MPVATHLLWNYFIAVGKLQTSVKIASKWGEHDLSLINLENDSARVAAK